MDFVRERREWEERLKKRAPSFEIEADDTLMDEVDQDMEDQGEQWTVELLRNRLTIS